MPGEVAAILTSWRRVFGEAECETCGAKSDVRTIYAQPINRHDPDEGDWHICFLCIIESRREMYGQRW